MPPQNLSEEAKKARTASPEPPEGAIAVADEKVFNILDVAEDDEFDNEKELFELIDKQGFTDETAKYNEAVLAILSERIKIDWRNDKQETYLIKACSYGQLETANSLLRFSADVNCTDSQGETAFDISKRIFLEKYTDPYKKITTYYKGTKMSNIIQLIQAHPEFTGDKKFSSTNYGYYVQSYSWVKKQ